MITRTFPIVVADDLEAMRDFYTGFLGFTAAFDSDWFIDLQSPGEASRCSRSECGSPAIRCCHPDSPAHPAAS
ncbi:VOC family protein [Microlunatus soli]|uniref:VOC family protein n=1 Tax=Microlunatus soli TaxID=630515 RepID=UPI0012FA4DCC|nr:VOC family protein [Microlunatus soli]